MVEAESAPRPRILVAEDDDDSRELLSMVLRASGYQVVEAADGCGALSALEAGDLEVALVDIGLPGMDGEAVARNARSSGAGRLVHMVAVTGYGDEADVERLLGAGFDAHLVKPVDLSRLRQILANHTHA